MTCGPYKSAIDLPMTVDVGLVGAEPSRLGSCSTGSRWGEAGCFAGAGAGGVFNTISGVLCTAHLVGRVAPNLQYVGVTEHDIPSTSHFVFFPACLEVFLSSIVTSKTFALLFLGALELDPELVLILSDCV